MANPIDKRDANIKLKQIEKSFSGLSTFNVATMTATFAAIEAKNYQDESDEDLTADLDYTSLRNIVLDAAAAAAVIS